MSLTFRILKGHRRIENQKSEIQLQAELQILSPTIPTHHFAMIYTPFCYRYTHLFCYDIHTILLNIHTSFAKYTHRIYIYLTSVPHLAWKTQIS
jgi:hypothetical protein